jgi:hypothetical protein
MTAGQCTHCGAARTMNGVEVARVHGNANLTHLAPQNKQIVPAQPLNHGRFAPPAYNRTSPSPPPALLPVGIDGLWR